MGAQVGPGGGGKGGSFSASSSPGGMGGAGAGSSPRGDWGYSDQLNRIERVQNAILNNQLETINVLANLTTQVNRVLGQELSISKKEKAIMAAVQVEQDDIDAVATSLNDLVAEVDSLDTSQLPAGTLDGLKSAASSLADHINAKLPVTNPVTPPAS